MTTTNGLVYDAVSILGFGAASEEPLPEAKSGEVIIRYGGWSLQELCAAIGKQLMHQQNWYHEYQWSTEKLPARVYRLRIPVQNSNRKTFAEQERILPASEQTAPVVLVATALLAHRLQTKEDLLKTGATRCKERTAVGDRVELDWSGGRLYVYDGDPDCGGRVWLSSVGAS